MILTEVEKLYFNRLIALKKIRLKPKSETKRVLEELSKKLPIKEN